MDAERRARPRELPGGARPGRDRHRSRIGRYVDLAVTNDVQYTYTVAAVDTHGNRSVSSSPASATPTDLGAPAVPTGLVATPGDGQVSLSWTPNAETDLSTYRLLRDGVQVVALSGTTYVDAGLTNDTTYSYTLAAVDTHGNRSADSPPVTATPTDLAAPAAPDRARRRPGRRRVDLSWTANAEPDVATYRVLRDGVEIATVAGTAYTDTGRTNDVTYAYRLVAVDTHGNRSPASSSASATPTDLTPPAAPTGLAGTRGSGKITLAWTANTEPDLATYRVLRDGVEIATVTGTTYLDNGRPTARPSPTRSSPWTPTATARRRRPRRPWRPADVTPPAVPSGSGRDSGEGQVGLSWSANTEPDLASYRLLRDGVEIAGGDRDRASLDTGLTNGTTTATRWSPSTPTGNRSAASAPVLAAPADAAPAAPTGVTAVPGDRRAVVSWTAPADADVVGYRVLSEDGGTLLATTAAPTTQAAVSGLTNGTPYRFTVVAVDAGGHVSVLVGPERRGHPRVPGRPDPGCRGVRRRDGERATGGSSSSAPGPRWSRRTPTPPTSCTSSTGPPAPPGGSRRSPAGATGATRPDQHGCPGRSAPTGRSLVLATTAALRAGRHQRARRRLPA